MTTADKEAIERALEYILESEDVLEPEEHEATMIALAHIRKDKALELAAKL